jgi:hypothetical protein
VPTLRDRAGLTAPALHGDVVPDERVVRYTLDRLEAWFGPAGSTQRLANQIQRHRSTVPSDWVFRALKRLACEGYAAPGWNLLYTVIEPWFAAGAPDLGSEERYDDDLRLKPPSRQTVVARPGRGGYAPAPRTAADRVVAAPAAEGDEQIRRAAAAAEARVAGRAQAPAAPVRSRIAALGRPGAADAARKGDNP